MDTPQKHSVLRSRFQLAERKELVSKLDEALAIYDEMIVEYYYDDPNYTSYVSKAMFQRALIHVKEGLLGDATKEAEILLRFAKKRSFLVGMGQAYYILAIVAIYDNDLKQGQKQALKSLEIGNKISEKDLEDEQGINLLIRAHGLLGWVNYLAGETDLAIIDYMDAIVPAEQNNEKILYYKALNGIGKCYQDKGFHDKSLAYFEKAETLASEMNDIEETTTAIINIAIEKRYMGEYEKALKLLLETLDIRKELGLNYTDILKNIANIYYDIGEYKKSNEYFELALTSTEDSQWLPEKGMILGDYARLKLAEGDYSKTKELLLESLDCYEKSSGAELGLVDKLNLYVELLIITGDNDIAKKNLERASKLAEMHRSILEQQQCQLTRAILEKSLENYGNARIILTELLEDAKDYQFFEIHINTCLVLAELFLERYQWKQLSHDFKAAQDYIDEAEKLSQQAKITPKLIHTLIIKASLHSTIREFTEAFNLLSLAKEICQEKNFASLSEKIDEIIIQIGDRKILTDQIPTISPSAMQKQVIGEVIDHISHRKDQDLMNEFSLNQFFVTVFKHDIYGPQVFITEEVPFERTDEVLLSIGVFYTTAIGQGNRHHQGLFGPLPVSDHEEFSSLIHARDHKDSGQRDKRERGQSYCLFTLFYHSKWSNLFYDRIAINTAFENVLSTLDDLQNITPEFLTKLKKEIYSVVTSN
ncbi:MAG: tetratricopeptide repeat protein [Candidatus Hodarchaeales archaeon]|jgi:tetratricopeptide (TPR) repeat protein